MVPVQQAILSRAQSIHHGLADALRPSSHACFYIASAYPPPPPSWPPLFPCLCKGMSAWPISLDLLPVNLQLVLRVASQQRVGLPAELDLVNRLVKLTKAY